MRWRRERSDADLLRAIAGGDGAAFDEFYRRTAPWLTLRLRRRCRDDELVSEILQETFVAVWRSAGSYRGPGDVAGWVWVTASRKMIDAFRRRAAATPERTTALAAMSAWAASVSPASSNTALSSSSAEDEVLAGRLDARLSMALGDLSPELLAVVRATVLDGLTVRETAELLGLPEGTVKTRAMRARRQLREALS